ncbi:DegV family protein [Streptococcus thoraltensis]|uniref:DegV family protein n=1 Tax=Streptococcus thoraltensis TaxID=55085 RepID=UPI002A7EF363|nr:DegV family protein [Streptococcus thoraltensis]MDY4761252.1 DegV family protein [Streptococcus thoraltensis]
MTWKIVADSGCNLVALQGLAENVAFVRVPLTLQVGSQLFIDDEGLDVEHMLDILKETKAAATSACPSPDAYMKAFEGADNILVVTITGGLSGSQNSAQIAKDMYLEDHPNTNIHVIDSLSAGGEMDLLVQKMETLIAAGLSFDEVVSQIKAYQEKTKLIFILAKVDNLVKNGRLNKVLGKVIGLLNIRMVGKASSEGKLELLQKAKGQKKAVSASYQEMVKAGYQGDRVLIAHCHNDKICQQLNDFIKKDYPAADVQVVPTSGLCSFYAEDGGILMGYEI